MGYICGEEGVGLVPGCIFFGPCNRFLSHRVRIKKYYMRLGDPDFLMRVGSSGYTGSHGLKLTGGCTSPVFYILS